MPFTYSIQVYGSTERPNSTEEHLRQYLTKVLTEDNWGAQTVSLALIDLEQILANFREIERLGFGKAPTAEELLEKRTKEGYIFFDTAEQARQAGEEKLAEVNEIVSTLKLEMGVA